MRKVTLFILALILVWAGLSTFSLAEEKLTVTSNQQKIDYAQRLLTYQGDVKASWGEYVFKANQLQVYLTEENTLNKIIATGNVNITQSKVMSASCQKITYTRADGMLTLEGNVTYEDNLGNTLSASMVKIWTNEQKLEAEGEPVKATYIVEKGALSGTSSGESE